MDDKMLDLNQRMYDKHTALCDKHQELMRNIEEFRREGARLFGKISLESQIERFALVNQIYILEWVSGMARDTSTAETLKLLKFQIIESIRKLDLPK
jgi:hypothetical protein